MNASPYPKPSAIGGTLIRKVLAQFKQHAFSLPIRSPIFIATSGGVDSMVLAHLVATYGRKIIAPNQITLLHFDHQWRKESATVEKAGVRDLAKKLGVGFKSVKLAPPQKSELKSGIEKKENREQDARHKRVAFYESQVGPEKNCRYVFTAHHQNDLAETLFWRFIRGEIFELSEGIRFNDNGILRPFLKVLKEEIYAYARAEKVRFFEDPTNADPDPMRGFLRAEIFPALDKKFPGFVKKIASYADPGVQKKLAGAPLAEAETFEVLVDRGLNRTQRNQLQKLIGQTKVGQQIVLPGGRILECTPDGFLLRTASQINLKI